jgi:thioredoxin-dependent peroxiredoxin
MTSAHETVATALKEGTAAPKFKLAAFPSGEVSLDQFVGKKNVILAFYPKDDTPGCTKEMCAFSDDLRHFEEANTVVLGISCDQTDSHEKFAAKYNLKQTLLADPDGKVGKQYGTVIEGKTTANRKLFIIDKQGIIRHIHEGMPTNEALLAVVKNLK